MKKTLIMILVILLLVLIVHTLISSVHAGSLNIAGLRELNNENQKLDSSIQNLSKLTGMAYQQALADVSKSSKEYEQAKNDYNQLVELSTSNEVMTANQLQKYEIEYLWARIGKHATDEEVVLKIEITENSTSAATGYYDLNFTAEGDYVGITDFIYDIENDSSLGFKIEKFKMNQISEEGNDAKISATFTCTNIAINIDPNLIIRHEDKTEENSENTTNTNTTSDSNTTNSNTTTDTNTTKR